MSLNKRTDLLRSVSDEGRFSASKVAELLSVSRKSLYTKAKELSTQELAAKHLIDKLHTEHPAWGSRQLSQQLKATGIAVGRLKTRRYMNEMGIEAIYQNQMVLKNKLCKWV